MVFLDIGQGDSIFIETPSGRQALIDGGPPDGGVLSALAEFVPFGDRNLDIVLATHPDKDHIGGLPAVFEHFGADYYLLPGVKSGTSFDKALAEASFKNGAEKVFVRRGMKIDFGDGARLTALFPDRDVEGGETNTASAVVRLEYGEANFLFTGDSPKSIEKFLVALDGGELQSDILKAGHHGSRTSSDESFVKKVSPDTAVISAGEKNSYGHPHKEVTDILNSLGVKILGTYDLGNIVFTSDGGEPRLAD